METVIEAQQDGLVEQIAGVNETRRRFAAHLEAMASAVEQAESVGESGSGRLGLQPVVGDLRTAAVTLDNGVFRLLVLGDMKRGKSTFLNAVLGQNVLPRDVNRCTAVLTVLRFGEQPGATVHFNDGKSPRNMDLDTFRREYTIPPQQAEELDLTGTDAFPDVSHAVVEVPLSLLERGVEIIDSPGLNDTEARNEISLGYIRECQAILFMLSATQQITLAERRYLGNYISDRELSVFFLINMWDEIARKVDAPDDPDVVADAERRVRNAFRGHLSRFFRSDGEDRYDRRVFEISALQALHARLNGRPMEGTGFAAFLDALGSFLVHERAAAELAVARATARTADAHVGRAVETRLPLLYLPVEELQEKIGAVEPEFRKLEEIRDDLMRDIDATRRRLTTSLSSGFHAYLMALGKSFEEDFGRYEPTMKFFEFLRRKERERFAEALETAFDHYLNDRVAEWSRTAEGEAKREIEAITRMANAYAVNYGTVTHSIAEQLLGRRREGSGGVSLEDAPVWQRVLAGASALIINDYGGVLLASAGVFNWKQIVANVVGVFVFGMVSLFFIGTIPFAGIVLAGLGLGGLQAVKAKKKVIHHMRKELEKSLPELAREGRRLVYEQVDGSFSTYVATVGARIDQDIRGRRAELDNLVAQKRARDVDVRTESARLQILRRAVSAAREEIESEFDRFTA